VKPGSKAAATRAKNARKKDLAARLKRMKRSVAAKKGHAERKARLADPNADYSVGEASMRTHDTVPETVVFGTAPAPDEQVTATYPVFGKPMPTPPPYAKVGIHVLVDRCDLALDTLEGKLQRFLSPEPMTGHGGPGASDVARQLSALADRILELAGRVDL
jgi:hypothetical protein